MSQATCWNSSAKFSCAINELSQIYWLINGKDVAVYHIISTSPETTSGPQITLTIPGSYEFKEHL